MKTNPIPDAMIEDISRVFGSLGDVSRLRILRVLLDAEGPVHQGLIVERTGLSQANTSKHLSHLVQVGLVHREAHGNAVYFSPVMPVVGEACALVSRFAAARVAKAFESLH